LVLRRSATTASLSSIRISQGNRETVGSSSRRSLDECEPIEQRVPDEDQGWPAHDPSRTARLKPRVTASVARSVATVAMDTDDNTSSSQRMGGE
jgi:hypothetical protein